MHICVTCLYYFARACITLREIELRGSNLDTRIAEEQGYLAGGFVCLLLQSCLISELHLIQSFFLLLCCLLLLSFLLPNFLSIP